jgi:tripartite-type tricarboxylate transporter receptor subunit TctC
LNQVKAFCGFVGLVVAAAASAQTYPTRPIALVVPFSAGGPTDTIARIMAERMGRSLGQTVVVENTTGAGGSIGVGRVARAAPDGYALGIGHIGTHVISGAVYQLPFDLLRDLEPVAMIATNPQFIVSKNAVPARDLRELLAWVKANQEKVSIGDGGAGTPGHVSGVYFKNVTATQAQIIHYRGAAPATQDLLSGQIDMMFDQAANSLPQIRAGRMRAYAVTSKTRLAAAPDIPTAIEAGVTNFVSQTFFGLFAAAGTPKAVLDKINQATQTTWSDKDFQARLIESGFEPMLGYGPERADAYLKQEIARWAPIVQKIGTRTQ